MKVVVVSILNLNKTELELKGMDITIMQEQVLEYFLLVQLSIQIS